MAIKVAVPCDNAPDRSAVFSWGLKVSDYKELYFLTGRTDSGPDGRPRYPNDPVAQARSIFQGMVEMLEKEGWSVHDVIRVEPTFTKDVDLKVHRDSIFKVWADIFKDVDPKPAAGTLRIAYALARPGLLVEFELLAAR